MKLAVCSATLPHLDSAALLDWLQAEQLPALELGVGGWPGTRHADANALLTDPQARHQWQVACRQRGIQLAALACHGNPLHPQPERAARWHADFMAALELANQWEVPVVVGFSGQPGTGDRPNWPVVAWPDDFYQLHEHQWQTQIIPYWQAVCERAATLGVTIAIEMHGGFAVHSPATLLRLRQACGPRLAANLDPSHLWWQGIDPQAAAHLLRGSIAHVHLKDTRFNAQAMNCHGVLDMTPHSQPGERAWSFAVPGEGHDAACWSGLLQALRDGDYTGVLSIEHEAPIPVEQGIRQCAAFIRPLLGATVSHSRREPQ